MNTFLPNLGVYRVRKSLSTIKFFYLHTILLLQIDFALFANSMKPTELPIQAQMGAKATKYLKSPRLFLQHSMFTNPKLSQALYLF